MLTIALSTMRARWSTFVSTFAALALGAGLVAAAGLILAGTLAAPQRLPQRYATAPVVVTPLDTLQVLPAAHGLTTMAVTDSHGLTADVIARVSALGPAVPDRIFYAQLSTGASDQVGRPWSAAAFASYRLVAGVSPATDNEIVVAAGRAHVGDRVDVLTVAGAGAYTVVGLTAPVSFEDALFFTDHEAARLSPRVDALVSRAPAALVRAAVGDAATVRTGAARRALDPDVSRDNQALVAANALVGTAGGIAGFVSVFVVAVAFAYSVGQRRRELALLHLAGATAGQVRRLVLVEATAVGGLASAVGSVLGWLASAPLSRWLVDLGVAPPWFTVPATMTPLIIAFVAGLMTALVGAWSAARRAGRIRPAEAARDAAIEGQTMTVSRWICGSFVACGALAMVLLPTVSAPGDALNRKHYIPEVMVLVVAFAILAPALIPPIVRLMGRPLMRLPGAVGLLVSQGALSAARRTAATAAPVLLTVGLAIGLLGTTATVNRARTTETQAQTGGDYVISPTGTPGLNREVVNRVDTIAGVQAAATYPMVVYDVEDGNALIRHPAHAINPSALPDLLRLPVVAGSVADLNDNTIIVDQDWDRQVGETVRVWLGDGTSVSLRIVAVIRAGAGGNGAYVTSRYAPSTELAEQMLVKVRSDADPPAVATALRHATAGLGATALPTARWAAEETAAQSRVTTLGLDVVLGITLLYSLLSVAGTMLMASHERIQDLKMVRLAGATAGQLLRMVAAEALLIVALGTALACGAAVLALAGLWLALLRLVGPAAVVIGWQPVAVIIAACTVVALVTALLPAALALRTRLTVAKDS